MRAARSGSFQNRRKVGLNMGNTTVMRELRLRHHIRLSELAHVAGVSHQFISDIELGKQPAIESNRLVVERAFERVIQARYEQIERLADEVSASRFHLLESEEND